MSEDPNVIHSRLTNRHSGKNVIPLGELSDADWRDLEQLVAAGHSYSTNALQMTVTLPSLPPPSS